MSSESLPLIGHAKNSRNKGEKQAKYIGFCQLLLRVTKCIRLADFTKLSPYMSAPRSILQI
jgi:hypothetical protein